MQHLSSPLRQYSAKRRRLVSRSRNLTELFYGIGAFDEIVGVSEYTTYPAQVKSLATVGGWRNPIYEKLDALRPDPVVLDDGQAAFVADKCKDLGLSVLTVPDQTIRDIYAAISASRTGDRTSRSSGAARAKHSGWSGSS